MRHRSFAVKERDVGDWYTGWYFDWLREHQKPSGDVPPPWHFLDCHPFRIHWRMGIGESYLAGWRKWWTESCFTIAERVSYFKRWEIKPAWLTFVAQSVWDTDIWGHLNEEERSQVAENLDSVGIASEPHHSKRSTRLQRIFEVEQRYGEFPPPWFFVEDSPEHLAWRTLGGVTLVSDWQHWWSNRNLDKEERIRYFKRWPMESCWLDFAVGMIWAPEIVYENRKLRCRTL